VTLTTQVDALETILTNLLSNAIKYTPDNGHITVTVTTKDKKVFISVADTGIGISPANQQMVFDRFTRVVTQDTENIPGSGVGLALTKELVENNAGTVTLNSEVGKGSDFIVSLPINTDAFVSVESFDSISYTSQIEIETLMNASSGPTGQNKTIKESENDTKLLLIDDNPDMLQLLLDTLQKDYTCLTAPNGSEGLELATQHLPDLIISDVMMPGIDGFEVVKAIKNNDLTCHIPVILLTARGDMSSRLKGWSEKADEYLEKPFNELELCMRVENLLAIRLLLRHRYQHEFFEPPQAIEHAEDEIKDINQPFIDQLNAALDQFYEDETLDISKLASAMFLGPRQLSRKVKTILGLTPVDSIRSFRLKKAAQLLSEGVSASLVFEQVGFTSHSYFSQCFKAQYNCAPSRYSSQKDENQ
ncbi:MAG: response regulator, partial [Algicola sp.]|nr:response regulator [Algicola sp.]